jgi:hypothetical protein
MSKHNVSFHWYLLRASTAASWGVELFGRSLVDLDIRNGKRGIAMSSDEVIETVYGKFAKYEIVKKTSVFGSPKFYIRKNGSHHRGPYSTLGAAVKAAEDEG